MAHVLKAPAPQQWDAGASGSCHSRGGSCGSWALHHPGLRISTPHFPLKVFPGSSASCHHCTYLSSEAGLCQSPVISWHYQRFPKDFLVAQRGQRAAAVVLDKKR